MFLNHHWRSTFLVSSQSNRQPGTRPIGSTKSQPSRKERRSYECARQVVCLDVGCGRVRRRRGFAGENASAGKAAARCYAGRAEKTGGAPRRDSAGQRTSRPATVVFGRRARGSENRQGRF